MQGNFSLKYFLLGKGLPDWFSAWGSGWRIILTIILLFFLISGIRGCFVKEPKNINKPHVIVTPFAKVEKIDQSNVQVSVEEKPWEVSLGGAVLRFDNKDGVLVGGMIKRKF